MHKVEIRLGVTEGPAKDFEVYLEKLKDGNYVGTEPMQKFNTDSDTAPLVLFLEGDERIVVVAKEKSRRMVFDKDQNANIMLDESSEAAAEAELREAQQASSQAQQRVQAANAKLEEAKSQGQKGQDEAERELKRAQDEEAKLRQDRSKMGIGSQSQAPVHTSPSGNPTPSTSTPSGALKPNAPNPGRPASANTGPVDSKQVKADASTGGNLKPSNG